MLLEELGLLSTVQLSDDTPAAYTVHRWTATALGRRADPAALREAHRRAAQYWRWRVKALPQSRQQEIEDWLEARYHYYRAGEIDTAVEVTETICRQLDTWGVWQREEQLCRETLSWLPERSSKSAVFLHQLGIVAQKRGDYDQALEWYRKSLAILEELGNRTGMASSYGQLGRVAQDRGDYDQALEWYRKSLAIEEELGNRAGMATSYHQLGNVAYLRGDYDQALEWYRKSLAIDKELGNRAGMALSYGQMGILLTEQGMAEQGVPFTLQSLYIFLGLKLPQAHTALNWLRRKREMLGEEDFLRVLQEHLEEEHVQAVLELMEVVASSAR